MRAWRERKKAKLGVETYRKKETVKRQNHRLKVKTKELTEEQLEERRKRSRESMRKYREKLKLRQQQEPLYSGGSMMVQLNPDYDGLKEEPGDVVLLPYSM